LLVGASFEFGDAHASGAADLALTFGVLLSEQLAADLGVVPEGEWRDRVAVIGFCAALPAVGIFSTQEHDTGGGGYSD
jgi:hypothetical protein